MAQLIKSSVGRGGRNNRDDVQIVIDLLNLALPKMGKPKLADPNLFINGIYTFQMHHFGTATGRVDPNNITINKLNEVAHGAMVPGLPQSSAGVMNAWRDAIVHFAGIEADRSDRVTGPDSSYGGKQSPGGAKRLREYYRVFPDAVSWPDAEFENGKPGKMSWCGIFATWVLTQCKIPVEWGINEDSVYGMVWQSLDIMGTKKITANEDKYYGKGDICLVTEPSVVEPFPTHHFIVAEEPNQSKGTMSTIEGNAWDQVSGRRHSVIRNERPIQKYPHYSPFQPKEM